MIEIRWHHQGHMNMQSWPQDDQLQGPDTCPQAQEPAVLKSPQQARSTSDSCLPIPAGPRQVQEVQRETLSLRLAQCLQLCVWNLGEEQGHGEIGWKMGNSELATRGGGGAFYLVTGTRSLSSVSNPSCSSTRSPPHPVRMVLKYTPNLQVWCSCLAPADP